MEILIREMDHMFRKTSSMALAGIFVMLSAHSVFAGAKNKKSGDEISQFMASPGDKLKISVFTRPEFTNESFVNGSGSIAIPGIGRVGVSGLATVDIQQVIVKKLREHIGLHNPVVLVEFAEHRPFFVLGDVNNSGKFRYVIGTTVLQAVAISGGFTKEDRWKQESAIVDTREGLKTVTREYWSAVATRSRLMAERDNRDDVQYPENLLVYERNSEGPSLTTVEDRIFHFRKKGLAETIKLRSGQIKKLNREMMALDAQTKSVNETIRLTHLELKDLQILFKKGFARKSVVLDLERRIAELKIARLNVTLAKTRVEHKVGDIEFKIFEDRKSLHDEINQDLKSAEDRLVIMRGRVEAESEHLRQRLTLLRGVVTGTSGDSHYQYTIMRKAGEMLRQIDATETVQILPGDVLRVLRIKEVSTGLPLKNRSRQSNANGLQF